MLAAASTGRAARPLPLFYAASQAGKAIEACRGAKESKSHGLKLENLTASAFLEVSVSSRVSGRFRSVSDCLQSDIPAAAVTLGALARSLPELASVPPADEFGPRPIRVFAAGEGLRPPDDGWTPRLTGENFALVMSEPTRGQDWRQFLDAYGLEVSTQNTHIGGFLERKRGWIVVVDGVPVESVAPRYRGRRWLRPRIEGERQPPSPLMTWWLILYALSMLARYHPVAWVDALDLNSSPVAVILDRAMSEAMGAVPELVLQAVMDG